MTKLFIVIDDVVQPMPFNNWQDAYNEIERIRSQRTIITYEIIYEDDYRVRGLCGNNLSTSVDLRSLGWILAILAFCLALL